MNQNPHIQTGHAGWSPDYDSRRREKELKASLKKMTDHTAEKVREAFAAIRASSGWQTIESAPKDGSVLLIHVSEYEYPIVARWNVSYDCWRSIDGAAFVLKPTHWMRLPPPPQPAPAL